MDETTKAQEQRQLFTAKEEKAIVQTLGGFINGLPDKEREAIRQKLRDFINSFDSENPETRKSN